MNRPSPGGESHDSGRRGARQLLSPTLLIVGVIALAAVLRLARLNYAEFRGDDDDMVTAAYQALQHGWLQAHGLISSVPIDNGPVAMWLLMIPLAITGSLLAAQVWVALLNIAAVGLCYVAARDIWNRRIALLATLLYAVSPWAVMYSRRLWITAFDAPLALLAFWSLFHWLRRTAPDGLLRDSFNSARQTLDHPESFDDHRVLPFPTVRTHSPALLKWQDFLWPLLCGLAFSAFFQEHVVPMGEAVTLLLTFLLFWRILGPRRIAIAVITIAATMAPYVLTAVLPALGNTVTGQQASHPVVNGLSWWYFGTLVTGRGYQSIAPQASRFLDATSPVFTLIDWLAVVALVSGVLTCAWGIITGLQTGRRYSVARDAVLLLWTLVPPAGLMVHLVQIHPYYFVVSMPGIYIVESIGFCTLARDAAMVFGRFKRWPPSQWAIVAGFGATIAGAQLALAAPFFIVIPEYWTSGDYGFPLAATEHLVSLAEQLGRGSLVVVGGYDHDKDYTIYSTLQRAFTGARYADDRGILEYATAGPPTVYLTTDDQTWEATVLRTEFATSQIAAVTVPGQGQIFRFFRPQQEALRQWITRETPPLGTLENFGDVASLMGARVDLDMASRMAHVYLNWRLLKDPSQPLLMKVELVGSDGYVWTATDAVSYPAGFWHDGDASRVGFLDRIDLSLPSYLPPTHYDVRVRLLGIADGVQIGSPLPIGSLNISTIAPPTAGIAETLPHNVNIPVASGLDLAGWEVDTTSVQQHGTVGAVLFWKVAGPVTAIPSLSVLTPQGSIVASTDASEISAALPPNRWPPGTLLADRHIIQIDGRAQAGAASLSLRDRAGLPIILGPLTIIPLPRSTALPALPHPLNATFGATIRLAGYAVDPASLTPGTPTHLNLYWQAVGLPPQDETVFVHLVNAAGQLVAQDDGPPGSISEPTSTWEIGQVVLDTHALTIPTTLAAGKYAVQIGLYNLGSGQRLPVHGDGIAPGADSLSITLTTANSSTP